MTPVTPRERTQSASGDAGENVVELVDVSKTFAKRALFSKATPATQALKDVTLTVRRRSRFGLVGESGSGKTTLLRIMLGLEFADSGTVRVAGAELSKQRQRLPKEERGQLQAVFQDPMASLNPRMKVAQVIGEPLKLAGIENRATRVAHVLEAVGLSADAAHRYPHEFSGGQRQRISIARAIAPRPTLLLADEPVSALDVTVRAQILDLLDELAKEEDFTLVFVSHDLSVVRRVCDDVAVLHRGVLVECGPTESVYANPTDEYTRGLLDAVPTLERAITAATERLRH